MSNSAYIETFKKTSLCSGETHFIIDVQDNHGSVSLVTPEKDISEEDMELLQYVRKQVENRDEHGSDCDIIFDIFEYIDSGEIGININNTYYDWDDIKEFMTGEEVEISEIDRINPFSLFFIGDTIYTNENYDLKKVEKAVGISNDIMQILNKLAKDILEVATSVQHLLVYAAKKIEAFGNEGVGVGDTATDELIAEYLENKLKGKFSKKDRSEIGQDFYYMYHR
jgi:hypothetical protein